MHELNELGFVGREASKTNKCPLCDGTDWCYEISETVWMCGRTDPHHLPQGWKRYKDGKDGRPIYGMGKRGKDSWKGIEPLWKTLIIDDSQEDWQVDALAQMRYQMQRHFKEENEHREESLGSNSTKHSTSQKVPDDDYKAELEKLIPEIEQILREREPLKSFALNRLARKNQTSVSNLVNWAITHRQKTLSASYNGKEFAEIDFGEEEFYIPQLVPKGSAILVTAAPGAGKSSLVYACAKSILSGTAFDGRYPSKGKVLILQGDEGKRTTQKKIRKLGMGELDEWEIDFETNFTDLYGLEQRIVQQQFDIIICDSYSTLNRYSGFEEKDTGFALAAMEIRAMCDRLGCTCFLIHHLNKGGTTRGTTALEANVDEVWRITRESEKTSSKRFFTFTKSRSELSGYFSVQYDPTTGEIHLSEEEEEGKEKEEEKDRKPSNAGGRLLEFVRANEGKYFELMELANNELIAASEHRLRILVRELHGKGLLNRQRRKIGGTEKKWYYVYGVGGSVEVLGGTKRSNDQSMGDRLIVSSFDRPLKEVTLPPGLAAQDTNDTLPNYAENQKGEADERAHSKRTTGRATGAHHEPGLEGSGDTDRSCEAGTRSSEEITDEFEFGGNSGRTRGTNRDMEIPQQTQEREEGVQEEAERSSNSTEPVLDRDSFYSEQAQLFDDDEIDEIPDYGSRW